MTDQMLWPIHFEEWRPDLDPGDKIEVADIASYAFPPWHKERYTAGGWAKAMRLMVNLGIPIPIGELLDVRDFGATSEEESPLSGN